MPCEGFIHAYCEGYNFEGYIFRFVSILGERYTHGHVLDFYKQLITHPDHLQILGDGTQKKSYLYINDCLEAMLHVIAKARRKRRNIVLKPTISALRNIARLMILFAGCLLPLVSTPNLNILVATRVGLVTTRLFFSIPKKSALRAGRVN